MSSFTAHFSSLAWLQPPELRVYPYSSKIGVKKLGRAVPTERNAYI
jgi:hypothetical protein